MFSVLCKLTPDSDVGKANCLVHLVLKQLTRESRANVDSKFVYQLEEIILREQVLRTSEF